MLLFILLWFFSMSFFKTQATPSWPCPAYPHLPRPAVFGDTGLPHSAAPHVLGENISFPPGEFPWPGKSSQSTSRQRKMKRKGLLKPKSVS